MIKKLFKNNVPLIILCVVLGLLLLGVVFNRLGLIKYITLKKEVKSLKDKIQRVEEDNETLKKRIDSLKTDDRMIEKTAREKYDMIKKGEKTIIIEEE